MTDHTSESVFDQPVGDISRPCHFEIDTDLPIPIYLQIVVQVRCLVASGKLRPGAYLPSVREVASRNSVNPMTVSKAYSRLEAEGLLFRRPGLGMVVATGSNMLLTEPDRIAVLEPALQALARQALQLGINPDQVIAALAVTFKSTEQNSN